MWSLRADNDLMPYNQSINQLIIAYNRPAFSKMLHFNYIGLQSSWIMEVVALNLWRALT